MGGGFGTPGCLVGRIPGGAYLAVDCNEDVVQMAHYSVSGVFGCEIVQSLDQV